MINAHKSDTETNADKIVTLERDEALVKLERLTCDLRFESKNVVSFTLFNAALALLTASGFIFRVFPPDSENEWLSSMPIILSLLFSVVAITGSIRFDDIRKEGDAYFEELSDELHGARLSKLEITEGSENSTEKFSLKARIIMRNYSNNSSIPLIPGKYGPGIMTGANLLFAFLTVLFTGKLF